MCIFTTSIQTKIANIVHNKTGQAWPKSEKLTFYFASAPAILLGDSGDTGDTA